MSIVRKLTYLSILLIPIGELGRLQIFGSGAVHPGDVIIGIAVLSWFFLLVKNRNFSVFKSFLTKPLFIFLGICLVSLLVNIVHLNQTSFLISLLYSVRFFLYAMLFFIIKDFDKKQKILVVKLLVFSGAIIVVGGIIQYFLYPNLRNLYYLGWDEHLYRLFSSFLDPNFAAIFISLFLTFFLSVAGILVVLFLLIKFGFPLLVNFSLFLSNSKQGSQTVTKNGLQFVAPPVLLQTFTATNTAQITVNGTAEAKEQIKLYVNTQQMDEQPTDDTGKFSFSNVHLNDGDNTIFVKATKDNKDSDSSNTLTITYKKSAPSLTIGAPSDGQSFTKDNVTNSQTPVSGKTDPDTTVTVNGYQAIVDASGNYSYTITLTNGDNHIHVEATDSAGNKTAKDITIKYQQ